MEIEHGKMVNFNRGGTLPINGSVKRRGWIIVVNVVDVVEKADTKHPWARGQSGGVTGSRGVE